MNSIFNKNLSLFNIKFPELSKLLAPDIDSFINNNKSPFSIVMAKNGEPTAVWNNLLLHSKYNPSREAEQTLSSTENNKYSTGVFFSCGLGYLLLNFAKLFPDKPIVLIEPDFSFLLQAFTILDWEPILTHREIVLAIGANPDEVVSILDRYKIKSCSFYLINSQTAHAKDYYDEIHALLNKQKQKEEINTNTLEKFSHLWLRNSCTNLHFISELDGVAKYKNCTNLPFVILAAGPSLNSILPYLKEIKKHSILVCVDTALHACLRHDVEPDFIILVDPQYACALHLEFLNAPSSILITESAAYPSVFRFNCKEKVLCSSLFPIGQYFETKLGNKGKLGAGGSVTTTAWDFARLCGSKKIYLAGMDLGFPNKQTHIKGSQFEERSHRNALRYYPAETDSVNSLFGAFPSIAKDYNGNTILTDKRMALFSWWFETNCERALREEGIQTFTLTPSSLAIPGIITADINSLLNCSDVLNQKKEFFIHAEQQSNLQRTQTNISFEEVFNQFVSDLNALYTLAKKGKSICDQIIHSDSLTAQKLIKKSTDLLNIIDKEIINSSSKDAASLVFPTERQLETKANSLDKNNILYSFYYSKLIYTEIINSIKEYKLFLI